MQLASKNADIFVPDGIETEAALARTTHMGIGAHQDDLEIFAYHGILECYTRDNRWFTGITATNGSGSPRTGLYADCTDEDMQKVRQGEQKKAATVGEYACQVQLMVPSSEVKDPAAENVVKDLTAILTAAQPEILYLHSPADKHDTHVATLLRALSAARSLPRDLQPKKVYGCEVWRNLDWMNDADKQALAVDQHPNLAMSLLGTFDSQVCSGKRYDLATTARRLANATFFESHAVDDVSALTWGMDLTPLLEDENKSVADHAVEFIERFKTDVTERILKFQ